MPDLGRYTVEVLSAYGGTMLAIALLIGWSVWRARRVLHDLRAAEARQNITKEARS